jgi:hypothetical protein
LLLSPRPRSLEYSGVCMLALTSTSCTAPAASLKTMRAVGHEVCGMRWTNCGCGKEGQDSSTGIIASYEGVLQMMETKGRGRLARKGAVYCGCGKETQNSPTDIIASYEGVLQTMETRGGGRLARTGAVYLPMRKLRPQGQWRKGILRKAVSCDIFHGKVRRPNNLCCALKREIRAGSGSSICASARKLD